MKRAFLLPIMILVLVYSCESYEQEEVTCLPVNMTATIIDGAEAKKIIADFNYVPGTNRLDHITWSNHQTHYFEYDETERISVVRMLRVDTKVQEEKWFIYDGTLVDKIILVKKHLDMIFLEPVDSLYLGYIDFEYQGEQIISERRYEIQEGDNELKLVRSVEYEYDGNGNMLLSEASDPTTQLGERKSMTYDSSKHPFSDLQYYFTGETFVNNLLSKQEDQKELNFDYDLRLNEYGYPEIIFEKLGSINSRIIRYSYMLQ